jgi:hypothetical protein
MGGQGGIELTGETGSTAALEHGPHEGWAWAAREDVGKDTYATRGEDPADLGDPGRLVGPVAHRHGGEHQVEDLLGEGQVFGTGADVADSELGGGRRDGRGHHSPGQVDTDKLGQGIPLSCLPQQPTRPTADIQDPARIGKELLGELEGGLLNRSKQRRLQRAGIVGARPPVEPGTTTCSWVARHSSQPSSPASALTPPGVPMTTTVSPGWKPNSGVGAGNAVWSRNTATIETPVRLRAWVSAIVPRA